MFKFIHHILQPHCSECKEEREEIRLCKSCETLHQALDQANYEKKELMNLFIEKQRVPGFREHQEDLKPIKPLHTPWRVRQQTLEAEDRVKARLMKQSADANISVEELEKEIGIVEEERENAKA